MNNFIKIIKIIRYILMVEWNKWKKKFKSKYKMNLNKIDK